MKIKITKNNQGILESNEYKIHSGYENENFAYELEFEFPDYLQEYAKLIEFELDGNKVYDVILENKYKLKNNVTKYPFVPCQITFIKSIDNDHTQVYKTNKFYLEFGYSINADLGIDPESEEVNVLNTLIEQVTLLLEEVTDLQEKGDYAQEQGDYAKEQGDLVGVEIDRIETMLEGGELNGATFTPNVSATGDISWTNDKNLPNPRTRNIKGDTGLTPNIQAGTTTTLTPESNAYVEIVGTTENPIINFYIPRGRNGKIEFRLVNSLPQTGEEGVVYLVPSQDPEQQNVYDEFIWINNTWERFGSASIDIDLSRYYTKDEIATILLDYETKQELISTLTNYVTNSSLATTLASYVTSSGLATTLLDYVTTSALTTELAPYVKNTDYATAQKGGVVKVGRTTLGTGINNGELEARICNYEQYLNNLYTNGFISKGTLENVITGKELVNKTYVDTIVGNINTLLDELNGEVI